MRQKIKLMADYECWPLWWASGEQVGDINPSTLPLRQETIARLAAWSAQFNSWLNWDDPAASRIPRGEAEAFEQEGIALWQQVRQELVSQYDVVYMHQGLLLEHPDELKAPLTLAVRKCIKQLRWWWYLWRLRHP